MQHSIEDLLKVKAAGSINANVPTPLYYQLYSLLKSLILDGSIGHSQRLPAEGQLAEMFDVSRITAKRAMDELAQDGLIERRRGRGSHVIFRFKARPVQTPLVGVLEEIERIAALSTAQVLECHVATPPYQIQTPKDLFSILLKAFSRFFTNFSCRADNCAISSLINVSEPSSIILNDRLVSSVP